MNTNTFNCDQCHKSYSYKRSLVRHINKNHSVDNNDIDNDDENSADDENSDDDENTFNCDQCHKSYSHKRSLVRHINENHSVDNDDENSDDDENDSKNDDGNNENSNKDVNESDMDCDDDELRVWKLLNTFISDPENNLQNKYINFQKLNEKLPNDKLHKTITTTANHFKNQCGLSAEEACKCTMNFLDPIFRDVLKKDNNDYFWDQFLQLPINENEIDNNDEENDNINNDYVNLVRNNYFKFLTIRCLLDNDKFN